MLVIIESPYSDSNGRSIKDNTKYAQECMKDSLQRGETPFASHLLYPQVLDESILSERERGISLGYDIGQFADVIAVYGDYGRSRGMNEAIGYYRSKNKRIEYRTIITTE